MTQVEGKQFLIAWPREDEEVLMLPGPRMRDILWYDVTGKEQIVGQTIRLNDRDYTVKILGMQVGAGEVFSEVKAHQEPEAAELAFALVGQGTMRVSDIAEGLNWVADYPLLGPLSYEELAAASFQLGITKTGLEGEQEQLVLLVHTGERTVAIQSVTTSKGFWHETDIVSAQDSTSLCWMCVKLTPQ